MKNRWKSIVEDYFTFTKKERIAVITLIFIGVVIYFLPRFFKRESKPVNKEAFEKELARLKITVDSSRQYRTYANDNDEHQDYYRPRNYPFEKQPQGELFAFDPNTLDYNGWKRLGLREKTIQTIQKFVAKGYRFRQPEDIRKIYGLHADEAERLIPYIHIESTRAAVAGNPPHDYKPFTPAPPAAPKVIDINTADSTDFIALPGIGSKLAARIINFRDKLGGFASVQQVAETYGVPDSTFQKIKPRLQLKTASVKTIDINSADANQLKAHPYIKWNVANAIVNYRKQHGNYKTVDELKRIDIIDETLFNKISPYLTTM